MQGMLGLGDNIHQRAVIKQMMKRNPVILETPWPSVYHDLIGDRLKLINRACSLRTQTKNAKREKHLFSIKRASSRTHKIWYTHDQIKNLGGFLAAMCANSGFQKGDFSLPVPDAWREKARKVIGYPDKPIMIYRPLVNRTEWNGCMQRNPDAVAYVELAMSVRDHFHVVSIADLEDGVEWAVSQSIGADIEFHKGELDFETIAGLMSIAGLVFCSPGFALVLAQAVGAPVVSVFGGHESARLYDHSNDTDCFIEPIIPCECFNKLHKCDKRIDLTSAKNRIKEFVHVHSTQQEIYQATAKAV